MRNELFTDHYGFVVDYLAEALRAVRKHNFTEIIDHHFALGSHLNARDRKAVRKTVSGLVKILYPHGEVGAEELRRSSSWPWKAGVGSRNSSRRWARSSITRPRSATRTRKRARSDSSGVPEQGGRDLISADPLAPGSVYAAAVTRTPPWGLYRIEVGISAGTGSSRRPAA